MTSSTGDCSRFAVLLIAAFMELAAPALAHADFPTEMSAAEVDPIARRYDCEKTPVDIPITSFLLMPRGRQDYQDGKYHQPYHAACHVYVPDPEAHAAGGYSQRFLIHGANEDSKPEMIRAARLLLILWDEEHTRLRYDHVTDDPTVQVWLSEQRGVGLSPDTGGEQFKNQIYIYDVQRERRPIEWTRELAHEYGHYALPGISGFQSPEEWANGVLGERLYLKWISEDIRTGKIKDTNMPYVTPDDLNDYTAKQVNPLIRRIDVDGIVGLDLKRRDAEGMDNYIALALYIDQFYGSSQLLSAMSYTAPAHQDQFAEAPDFLKGFFGSARSTPVLKITMGAAVGAGKALHTIYLTAGVYMAEAKGGVTGWKVLASGKALVTFSAHSLRLGHNGWYTISMELAGGREIQGISHLILTRLNRN